MLDKVAHIEQELHRVYSRRKGVNIAIRCINPEHNDGNPSFNIYVGGDPKLQGFGHCFSCGYKAYWNTIADVLGLRRLTQDSVENSVHVPRYNCLTESATIGEILEENNLGITLDLCEDWRNIPLSVLKKVNAVSTYDMKTKESTIVFPTIVNNEIIGITKYGENTKQYIHSKGEWAKKKGIYNYDLARKNKEYVILVEGIRDCLTLMKHGYNAVAILGTQSMSTTKADYIASSWEHIIIFADGDKAGKLAMKKWYTLLAESTDNVYALHTHKYYQDEDPGSIENLDIGYKYLDKLLRKKGIEK